MVEGVRRQSDTQAGRAAGGDTSGQVAVDFPNKAHLFRFAFFIPLISQIPRSVTMRRTSAWLGWALCLCASLAAGARDSAEDAEMRLDRIREDGTEPETGTEFLRCNKVQIHPVPACSHQKKLPLY